MLGGMLTDEVRNYVLLLHIYRHIVKGDMKIFESYAGGSKEGIVNGQNRGSYLTLPVE